MADDELTSGDASDLDDPLAIDDFEIEVDEAPDPGELVETDDPEVILGAVDLGTGTVEVPEWGVILQIRGVPIGDEKYRAYIDRPVRVPTGRGEVRLEPPTADEINVRTLVGAVILGVVRSDGSPMFKWSDAGRLRKRNLSGLARVGRAVLAITARRPKSDGGG